MWWMNIVWASAPVFQSEVAPIPDALAAKMRGVSWHEGCPVGIDALSLVSVSHWNDAGTVVKGSLVVRSDLAPTFVDVFETAFAAKYPVHSMRPVSEFSGDDARSMAANNTSAFNCRPVGGTQRYSMHSYGSAIDINPLTNPYVSRSGRIQPPQGKAYADRTVDSPQRLVAEHPVVKAFLAHGWGWGGQWTNSKDYQHFSESGR